MKTCSIVIGLGLIVPSIVFSSAHAQIPTVPRSGTLDISVEGRADISVPITGVLQANGKLKYATSLISEDGIEFSVNYIVDPTNNPTASISGYFQCVNTTSQTKVVDASFVVPACPEMPGGTLFGGTVTLLVTANPGGASINCAPGASSLWEAIVSDRTSHKMFFCPFQMSTTGSGTIQSNGVFGAPIPGLDGPESTKNIGSRNRFSVTPGDSLKVTSMLVVKSIGSPSGCSADLSGNGIVDAEDLAIILGNWGPTTNPCSPADLDANGTVDAKDVSYLLGYWGPCGE